MIKGLCHTITPAVSKRTLPRKEKVYAGRRVWEASVSTLSRYFLLPHNSIASHLRINRLDLLDWDGVLLAMLLGKSILEAATWGVCSMRKSLRLS